MQNFAEFIKANRKPLNQDQQDKWLTKDRFWNFVFWFGISTGLAVGDLFRYNLKIEQIASFINWFTLIIIPLLLLIFNRTRFIKKDTFANSEGITLTKKQMPYMFPLAIISGFALSCGLAETILPKGTENIIISFVFFFSLFSGLSLYFIFKNCPISILFNYKFWNIELHHNVSSKSSSSRFNISSSSSSTNSNKYVSSSKYVTNPAYSNLSCNIHHKR